MCPETNRLSDAIRLPALIIWTSDKILSPVTSTSTLALVIYFGDFITETTHSTKSKLFFVLSQNEVENK